MQINELDEFVGNLFVSLFDLRIFIDRLQNVIDVLSYRSHIGIQFHTNGDRNNNCKTHVCREYPLQSHGKRVSGWTMPIEW